MRPSAKFTTSLLLVFLTGGSSRPVRAELLPRELSEFERIAQDHEALVQIGNHSSPALDPSHLRVLIWNVQKAFGAGFSEDFAKVSKGADLILLQEAVHSPALPRFLGNPEIHQWHLARTFFFGGGLATGVATGALAKPFSVGFLRSPMNELYLTTPKMALFTRYKLQGLLRKLLVVNVHALNFVDRLTFMASISRIGHALAGHDGPVIFAGDFNTWSPSRYAYLFLVAQKYGLQGVRLKQDRRWFKLDHVLVRDVRIHDAELINSVESSDHKPIMLGVSIERVRDELIPSH